LPLFLLSRIGTGFFAGTGPVAKAYLADVGDETGKLATYLAWRDAASTLAFILGPLCGGLLFEFFRFNNSVAVATIPTLSRQSRALGYVIGTSAMGSFIAAMLILSFVNNDKNNNVNDNDNDNDNDNNAAKNMTDQTIHNDEKHATKAKAEAEAKTTHSTTSNTNESTTATIITNNNNNSDYEIVSCPLGTNVWTGVATVCLISFLYHVADSTFFAFFPALLQNTLQLDAKQIGLVFTMLSSVTFLFSATSVSSRLIQSIGVVRTCALGLSAVGVGLGLLSLASTTVATAAVAASATSSTLMVGGVPILIFGAAAIYFSGVPLYGPTIPTMLLQCVPPHQRGTGMLLIKRLLLILFL
jgi:hypothetical protein